MLNFFLDPGLKYLECQGLFKLGSLAFSRSSEHLTTSTMSTNDIEAFSGYISVRTLEHYLTEDTGHPVYDIRVGLRENNCLTNFMALHVAILAGDTDTTAIIYGFIKSEYQLRKVITAWDTAGREKMTDVSKLISKYVAKKVGHVLIKDDFPAWTAVVLLTLNVVTHGTSPTEDDAQVFAVQLLESISEKKGPALTRYFLETSVAHLILVLVCFKDYQDRELGQEVLDVLFVTRIAEFHDYLVDPTRPQSANDSLAQIVRDFGNEAGASYVANPHRSRIEPASYAMTTHPMGSMPTVSQDQQEAASSEPYHHGVQDDYTMDLDV